MVRLMIDASCRSIRIAGPSDSVAVSAVLAASYSSLLKDCYDSDTLGRALPFMTRANPALLASGTYYVAEGELGNLLGCGGWTTERPGSGEIVEGEAHIRHFATHPEWVRRRVGTALLARCLGDARLLGIRKLNCFSTLNACRLFHRPLLHAHRRRRCTGKRPALKRPLWPCWIRLAAIARAFQKAGLILYFAGGGPGVA